MSQVLDAENLQRLIIEWSKQQGKIAIDERKANIPTSDDIVIGSRIRPLLENEIEDGHYEGARLRPGFTQVIDILQVVSTVRSGPQLRVCCT